MNKITTKFFLSYIVLFITISAFSQVGIGTTNPNAKLDIKSTSLTAPTNTDGVLIPKMNNFPATNPTIVQDGMLVFITGNGTPSKGFYYWNQPTLTWIPLGGNSGVKKIDDLLDGKSDPNGSSVFLGTQAGLNDDGTSNANVGVGLHNLRANTSGVYNTGVGNRSLFSNTTGNYNTGLGGNALFSNTTGNQNTALGLNALYANTTGINNTASGVNALRYATTGSYNVADGSQSLFNLTVGNRNTVSGYQAMFKTTEAYRNTASGFRTLYNNTTGTYNTAFGYESGYNNTNGVFNVFIGHQAGYFETSSNKLYIENRNANANNALIYGEFGTDATRTGNILRTNSQFQIGNPTLTGYAFPTIDGAANQVLKTNGNGGLNWINANILGTDNQNLTGATLTGTTLQINIENGTSTSINLAGLQDGGAKKINDLLDGKSDPNGSSVFLGTQAGLNDDGTSNANVGVGLHNLRANTSGVYNTGVGNRSLFSNTTGNYNTGLGGNALFSNTTGGQNTAIGINALYQNYTGIHNVATGVNALRYATTGSYNVADGSRSLFSLTVGNRNTVSGFETMFNSTDAYRNTASGFRTLYNNTTGTYNTAFGYESGYNNTNGVFNVFLGYQAGYFSNGSNKLFIENRNANANNALIYGEFGADATRTGNILRTNSQFQIGNPTLTGYAFPTIDGVANQVLKTNGNGGLNWTNANTLGTDNQNLTGATLTGTTLQINIENGTSTSVNLAGLQDGGAKKINDLLDGKSDPNGSSVFLGTQAGLNDDGSDNKNIGVGFQSLKSNTTGANNTANGYQSMFANTSGYDNTANGYLSLYSNTIGTSNTATGANSLFSNTIGFRNTANGYYSMFANTRGFNNTANGYQSMSLNTSGYDNTAIGYVSLHSNTTGYNNTALGGAALVSNTTGNFNTAVGGNSLIANSTGNANTAIGYQSLALNRTGLYNNAFGVKSLFFNTTGQQNVAVGNFALYANTTGNENIAVGVNSLRNNNSGTKNIAVGTRALLNNTNGFFNTAIGWEALNKNIGGYNNTGIGSEALGSNNSGIWNVGLGNKALFRNTTGKYNTAVGGVSLLHNTTGSDNTASGVNALAYNSSGNHNSSLGMYSLYYNMSGSYNTGVGYFNGYPNPNVWWLTNSTALGSRTFNTASNQVRIGSNTVTSIGGFRGWTNLSDGRFKKNVKENVKGLDFILKLRPVTYNLDIKKIDAFLKVPDSISNGKNGELIKFKKQAEKEIQTGFIAQEVEQAAKELGYDFSGVDKPKNENDYYGLRYAEFVVPLVKGMQEQQKEINDLKYINKALKDEVLLLNTANETIKRRLDNLRFRLEALEKK